ncbi:MAG: flippase [candidate division WOR-3 bacterium]
MKYFQNVISIAFYDRIVRNAASLYLLQFANYLMPFITFPYLVRVLGPYRFGTVAFAQGLMAFFITLVDYGTGLSATRKISIQQNDITAVSRTTFNVWGAQFLLYIVGLFILLILATFVPKIRVESGLFFILYGMVIGNILLPIWLFQGMEKMTIIPGIYLITRCLYLMSIFILIHGPDDYILYGCLISLNSIVAGFLGVIAAFRIFKLRVVYPTLSSIWSTLREGGMIFFSMICASLYAVGNAFILGMLADATSVGYYSAGEKIVKALQGLITPIAQAVYPRSSKLASVSKNETLKWVRLILFIMGGFGLMLSVLLFFFTPLIVKIIMGSSYEPSNSVLRILSPCIFLVAISNVFGIQIMLPFKRDKSYTLTLFSAAIINLVIAILIVPKLKELGMAIAVLFTETFVALTMFIYLYFKGLNPISLPFLVQIKNLAK